MTLAELQPDVALVALLNEKVEVQTSATSKYVIKAYEQAKMPNKGLADEFLTVGSNGGITSSTYPIGLCKGNLYLTIYCKANADNTAKTARIKQMIGQCVKLVDRKTSQGIFFRLDPANVITPPYVNQTSGYATTVINVKWKESR